MPFLDLKHAIPMSYLYPANNDCHHYRFQISDDQMAHCSLLPACEINGKKITFNYTNRYVLQCDNEFIDSTKKPLKNWFTKKCNQEDLNKIATIINFLAQGTNYTYIENTAQLNEGKMTFAVKEEQKRVHYQVSLPSLEKNDVYYELAQVSS